VKLLWIPQLSSLKDGKFYVTSDSNWNFFANIAKGLAKHMDITIVLPYSEIIVDFCDVDRFIYEKGINVVHTNFTKSVFGSRFNFNYDENRRIVDYVKPDYIWENNPTHVRAWKVIIDELNLKSKLITYLHFIDT
jgi:hypothetical protein